ncbi:MAG: chemotaxis response regulator protein-glutamate methylesterase [Peptococcaceae bacterium]|nr:chemotaxis response regulator protein-glutamate methylesterase [Peptococcaceae bacterium]
MWLLLSTCRRWYRNLPGKKIRCRPVPVSIFIVDDSPAIRKIIGGILARNYGFKLVGTARNGQEALEQIPKVKPDVVILDVEMPVLDGLSTLKRLMRSYPVPVLMLSAHTCEGSSVAIDALANGAVDFVLKPTQSTGLNAMVDELVAKIEAAAAADISKAAGLPPEKKLRRDKPAGIVLPRQRVQLIVIGCSTGGPAALRVILPSLPPDFKVPVLVVQHMPAGFTASLAENLDARCALRVKHAADGDMVKWGGVLIAPSGKRFALQRKTSGVHCVVRECRGPLKPGSFCPSVDEVMTSAAEIYGSQTCGVVLTGMGRDGLEGMRAIKAANGLTIAQDESTCVVYGMPKAVVDAGLADNVIPLPQIGPTLVQIVEKML